MKIAEFATLGGVSPSKVRFYERRGLLPAATRTVNGHRRYGPEDLKQLLLIMRVQSLGFPLDQIAVFVALSPDDQRARGEIVGAAEAELADIDTILGQLKERRRQIVAFLDDVKDRSRRVFSQEMHA